MGKSSAKHHVFNSELIDTSSFASAARAVTPSLVLTDVNGPDNGDQYKIPAGTTGRVLIETFRPNDTLHVKTKLFDSNNDGIVTFGKNKVLDLNENTTIQIDGINPAKGLRYLGFTGNEHEYADATVRPKGAIEGTVDHDTISGTSKADIFFFDNSLSINQGNDKIVNFDADKDLIYMTQGIESGFTDASGRFTLNDTLNNIRVQSVDGRMAYSLEIVDAFTSTQNSAVTYFVYRPNFDTEPRDMML